MVIVNNSIRLREIQTQLVEDQVVFQGIDSISISTIDRIIQRNQIRTKQLYRAPYKINANRVKEQRFQYVQVTDIQYRIFTMCIIWPVSPAHQHSTVFVVQYCNSLFLYIYFFYYCRGSLSWMPWLTHMSTSSLMRQGST